MSGAPGIGGPMVEPQEEVANASFHFGQSVLSASTYTCKAAPRNMGEKDLPKAWGLNCVVNLVIWAMSKITPMSSAIQSCTQPLTRRIAHVRAEQIRQQNPAKVWAC